MTTTTPPASRFDHTAAPGGTVLRSSAELAKRGLRSIRRLPSAFFPALMMPVFQAIAFSGTYYAITKIPGFPTDRSINWFLPLACCMGSGFSGVGLGFSTVRDLETGFYDRLRMSPAPPAALITGPLITAWIRTVIVVATVLVVGVIAGARFEGGPLTLVTLLVACLGIATIGAGWGLGLAFRFRDMRAAALMQLTLFIALFLTEAQMPLSIMTGWLETVARWNPFNLVLRVARSGFLGPITWDDTWPGLVAIVALSGLTLAFARRQLARLAD
jgi:ABC-2 type transport system permease protein